MIRSLLVAVALLSVLQGSAQTRIWGMGSTYAGQLGNATTNNPQTTPIVVDSTNGIDPDWTFIATGDNTNLGIKDDGSLWAWGRNQSGQGGNGTNVVIPVPRLIDAGTGAHGKWLHVSTSFYHSLGVREDGSLWAWGSGGLDGLLGLGSTIIALVPTMVDPGTGTHGKWTKVAAGAVHSVAIRQNGSLWTWGNNGNGQLGIGNFVTAAVNTPGLVADGTGWGGPFVAIGATQHSVAIRQNGSIWAWGWNNYGQTGTGTINTRIPDITCIDSGNAASGGWLSVGVGYQHNVGLRADGSIWTWGANTFYQIGNGTNTQVSRPTLVHNGAGGNHGKWKMVAAGQNWSMGIRADSTFWVWGHNNTGQLGNGTLVNITTITNLPALNGLKNPVIAGGAAHTLVLERSNVIIPPLTDAYAYNFTFSGSGFMDSVHRAILTVKNIGNMTITNPVLHFTVNNTSISRDSLSVTLNPGDSVVHTFRNTWTPRAAATVKACGFVQRIAADIQNFNDTSCVNYVVRRATPNSVATAGKLITRVYPNPARDMLFLEAAKGMHLFQVRNQLGQLVYSEALKNKRDHLYNTTMLVPGIYSLQVTFENGSTEVVRFVKQ